MDGDVERAEPRVLAADEPAIAEAASILAAGGLVGMPTETVYGLACHAFDPRAAAKVFANKGRPSFDPLIVHVAKASDAATLVSGSRGFAPLGPALAGLVTRLAEAFWPGALTMVLPKPDAVPGIVTAGLETVGVRVPAHPVAQSLIAALGERTGTTGAVAAPSANVFGGVSPSRAEHVRVACDLVLDGGPCATGVESTVVRPMEDGTAAVLRLGGVSVEALAEALGEANVRVISASADDHEASTGLASPGTTLRHYAPRTPMRLVADRAALLATMGAESSAGRRVGGLGMGWGSRPASPRGGDALFEDLSTTGDLTEAAANLFAAMHRLDAAGLDAIVAQAVPEIGLGRAINDRLRRASR
ncbi:MAG: L-threonylcarbamoyladenylate synthase [Planctomycetota bacterium]